MTTMMKERDEVSRKENLGKPQGEACHVVSQDQQQLELGNNKGEAVRHFGRRSEMIIEIEMNEMTITTRF